LAIIRIAFGARQFPWSATLLTAKTLAYLTPAIVSQAVIQILIRAFYAFHDTRTPLKISLVSLIVNISTSYLMVNFTDMGILGLAISASLGNVTQCIGLFYVFVKTVDGGGWAQTYWHYSKIILASFFMGVVSWICLQVFDSFVFDSSRTFNLIAISTISVILSIVAYYFMASWLRISEVMDYKNYYFKLKSFIKK
jgi:putative peptidoglycan lipid II flippase